MSTVRTIFQQSDFRRRLLVAVLIVFIFRFGAHIPLSFVDIDRIGSLFQAGSALGFLNVVSGGGLSRFSVLSLGILPFINASIIMQLLVLSFPSLKTLQDEGESGRKQIAQYTRYLAVLLSVIQSIVLVVGLGGLVAKPSVGFFDYLMAVISLVAGSSLVMWLGELLTERGFGNGSSILIFCGILSSLPADFRSIYILLSAGTSVLNVLFFFFLLGGLLFGIVISQEAVRRVSTTFIRRVSGNQSSVSKSHSYIPFKLINSGIMPIIFASAALQLPALVAQLHPRLVHLVAPLSNPDGFYHGLFLILLIFFFSYFYNAVTFNPTELAHNLNRQACIVGNVRPGSDTVVYLDRVISYLTLIGAIILSAVSVIPSVAKWASGVSVVGLGGTSLLIVVGVALEMVRHVKTYFVSNSY